MNPMNIFFFELLLISIREGAPHKHDVLWDRAFEHLLITIREGAPHKQAKANQEASLIVARPRRLNNMKKTGIG